MAGVDCREQSADWVAASRALLAARLVVNFALRREKFPASPAKIPCSFSQGILL